MWTLLLTTLIFGLSFAGLAAGVMFGRPPIKGSCGGLACQGACTACPRRKAEGRLP